MLDDENYKRLFGCEIMVEHLLRACLPSDLLAAADFSRLDELSAEYVSADLRKRYGDMVWRLRVAEHWTHLLIMLEFQSQRDRWMALRVHAYTALLYQKLVNKGAPVTREGRLPPVLPIVLYNGTEPWTPAREMRVLIGETGEWLEKYQPAQRYVLLDLQRVAADDLPRHNLLRGVAGLEQSRSLEDLLRVGEVLRTAMQDPRAGELRRAFVDWIRQVVRRLVPPGTEVMSLRTLEDVRMTLVERVAEWPKQWLQEGREQGLVKGRVEGLAEGRVEGLAEGRVEGLAEGRVEGRKQGIDQQRALLCRQAAARFGSTTSARLAEVVEPITDPGRLAEIGEWLVRCDTAAGFLARVDVASPS